MLLHTAVENFFNAKIGILKTSTIRWYRLRLKSLTDMYGERDIGDITPEDLDRWRAAIATRDTRYTDHPYRHELNDRGLTPRTLHGYVRAVRTFFNFCMRRHYVERNPSFDLAYPRLPKEPPKHITDADIDRLLKAARSLRDYTIVLILADTGCRVGGLASLTRDQIDLETGTLYLKEKFDKLNVYYLNEQPLTYLKKLIAETPPAKHNAVFLNQNTGEPLKTTGFNQVLKRLAEIAGVKGRCNPHSFRHHKARELLDNGLSLEAGAELLNHENIQTIASFYGRWTPEELREKHRGHSRKTYPDLNIEH